jgi:O-antigen/teichoic acid export membrane protein
MSARKDHITGPAFLLVAGRTAGLIATFAIGPLFARHFSVEDIGTYRTFFLLYATLYGLAQLGMAESLYYFVPRASGQIGRYVCNAALTLLVAGLACLGLLWAARGMVADFFSNPALPGILPLLGMFLTLTLVGTVLEITMISRKQHMSAAVTYALSDIGRTALFIVPALLFASLRAVFIGAVAFAALRLAVMLVIAWRQFGREFRPDLALWRTQLGYALPFALAVGVEVILISYHQYVVGGSFSPETFAIYATACMTIPLVDLIMTSTTSVMMVKMGERATDHHEALALFHDTVSRLAFLIAPLAVSLVVLANPFIITLYTEQYAASVPIFMVWVLTIVPAIFAVDAVLRVYAQTRFLLVMNLVRLGFVAGLIGWFLGIFGLPGAVLVTLTATVVAKSLAVVRIAKLLQVSLSQVLPWWTLGRIAARAAAAAVPAWVLSRLFGGTPWLAFVGGGAAYGITYLILCYAPGIAEPAAIRLPVLERIRREAARLPLVGRTLMAGPGGAAFRRPVASVVTPQGEK